jgi:hypothetical protein
MDRKFSVAELPINAPPAVAHRRQMLTQVWLPVIASVVIVLAVAILAIVGTVQGSSQINQLGNVSAIYLIIPVLIMGFATLALTGLIVYGLAKLLKKIPLWMLILQMRAGQVATLTRRGANTVVSPIMAVNAFIARVQAFWKKIFNKG